ncbi:MAG TPA: ABC transporter ATP-binding protein [Gammaproteobacteria bacterium]|nr:ABC transporter ATP-binding protein [Gammaproteobacteria bacterium]
MDDAIRLTDLEVRYGRVRALDGLSLAVPRGEIYGFLGRNGAGKTTTLRVLMGIVRADGGTIELNGKPMKRVSVATKRGIGYVSQEQSFYPWMTPRQLGRFVAAFYPSWDDAEFERLLRVLDIPADRRTGQLSGGTRTKVGLALALAPRPPLLLLDEPTTGLDPVARREFDDWVVAMAAERGITVFLSSHHVDEVEAVATRVGIIQAGRARIEGRVDDLRRRVRRVRALEPLEPPPGFARVRGDVWQADPEAWDAAVWPEGAAVDTLPLEEIFLAFARTDAPAAAAA